MDLPINALDVAKETAAEAAALIRAAAAGPFEVEHKGPIDLVTSVDRAAQDLIIRRLRAAFPDHLLIAEEAAIPSGDGQSWRWCIDPLDGTTNIAHGFPCYAVSIALLDRDRCAVGVVHEVVRDEVFWASTGAGAFLGDERLGVSSVSRLADALLGTGFPYWVHEKPDPVIASLSAVLPRTQGIRRMGSAAVDLCYVAAGRLDGFFELGLAPWDTAAGALIAEEAGAVLSSWDGSGFDPFVPQVIAAGPLIHAQLVELLSSVDISDDSTG